MRSCCSFKPLIPFEHDGLSAAILDHSLPDGDSCKLCARLKERDLPFLIYSGFSSAEGACEGALHLSKPAAAEDLVSAMERLINNPKRTTPS